MIDPVCSKYGWTYDYAMWGISYLNLYMMLVDTVVVPLSGKGSGGSEATVKEGANMTNLNWDQFMGTMRSIKNGMRKG
ncbi:MAG: hypothetical protein LKK08_06345 [Bacteroidales bacterium]|jgi:hypothetical protein|nr:hypothetical protein [Bacteroidales bacterium]